MNQGVHNLLHLQSQPGIHESCQKENKKRTKIHIIARDLMSHCVWKREGENMIRKWENFTV